MLHVLLYTTMHEQPIVLKSQLDPAKTALTYTKVCMHRYKYKYSIIICKVVTDIITAIATEIGIALNVYLASTHA